MRAQLSLEFMVYAALATASLAVSLRLFGVGASAQSTADSRAYAMELAAAIDSNAGYSSSEFSAYVPSAICGASSANYTLRVGGEAIPLSVNLSIDDAALCPHAGGIERMTLYRLAGGGYGLT